jgi:hypothetical protein
MAMKQTAEAAPCLARWSDLIENVAVDYNECHAISGKYKIY